MLQQRSFGSVKIISIRRDKLLKALEAQARRLSADHPTVQSVRVFGSIARGDQVGTSDVDILIVLHGDAPIDPIEQICLFLPCFRLPMGVDILVLTEGEVARRLRDGDPFLSQIWQESLPLYEPNANSARGTG